MAIWPGLVSGPSRFGSSRARDALTAQNAASICRDRDGAGTENAGPPRGQIEDGRFEAHRGLAAVED